MARVKRMERVVALTKQLVDHPYQLFSFTYFCKKFEVAKSTLSEDVLAVRAGLEAYDLGRVETLAGAAGGVRFIPCHSEKANEEFLTELALQLAEPERILSGGMIYMTDLLFKPQLVMRLGEIIAQRLRHLEPEYIMTVETRGIPLAVFVARAFNIPVVMARRCGSDHRRLDGQYQLCERLVQADPDDGAAQAGAACVSPGADHRRFPESRRYGPRHDRTGGRSGGKSCRQGLFHCYAGSRKENDR